MGSEDSQADPRMRLFHARRIAPKPVTRDIFGAVVWTQAYPVATADGTTIAEQINSKVPAAAADED
jgi:hypothetical protein